jgi:Cellulase (glycosyl hydrolase family 5)
MHRSALWLSPQLSEADMSKIYGKLGFYGQILTVIGLTAALAACGDSSGSDASGAAASTSSPAAISNPAAIKSPTASGTATTPATTTTATVSGTPAASTAMVTNNGKQIVDKSQTVWTVKSGVVYEQPAGAATTAAAGVSANVLLLYYANGVVYQENNNCLWWSWSGSTWVTASNPAPTATPACTPASSSAASAATATAPAPATSTASSGFGVKVAGSTFTDLSGNVLQLQGENVTALEINDTSMWDAYYGTNLSTWQSIASTWQMNIIRLPLNEWAWRTNATSAGGKPYQTIVATAVANITAAHMYVILDLHWATPNNYNNGVADGQPGYLDADNAVNFWSSVASVYKNNPAVMFELFNEPYADDQAFDSTRLNLLKNGGTFTFYNQASGKGNPTDTGVSFQVAGHQQLVTAIRATGATNVILYSCPAWNSEPSQSLAVMPSDPLNQLGATVHYANGSNADYSNIQAAGIPIVLTEYYTLANRGGYSWAQSNHIGYVMWGANNWNSSADLSSLVTNAPWSYNSASVAWPL